MAEIQKSTEPILYKEGKNGEAVLILHGFAVDIRHTDIMFDYFEAKGYTVARPIFPGHTGLKEDLKANGPAEYLACAREWLKKLEEKHSKIFIVGISFGSNIGIALAYEGHPKISAVVVSEMPVFFNLKMALVLYFVQPLYSLLGIEFISKSSFLYRKNHTRRYGSFNFIPVQVSGQIRDFIRKQTRPQIKNYLATPIMSIQAERSDLLNNRRAVRYITRCIPADRCKLYNVPINNHDLNILDDEGKILMLESVYQFIKGLS